FGLSFPILLGVAMIYPPPVAASVAFVASFEARELRAQLPLSRALYNRSQIAIAALCCGLTFHALAKLGSSPWYVLIPASLAESTAGYCVNVFLVATYLRVARGLPVPETLSGLRVGGLSEFLLSYLGLGFVGVIIARL